VITATGLQNGSTGDRTGARQFRTGLRLQW
jgi:hypothetical protein